jgi:hypothetical protein
MGPACHVRAGRRRWPDDPLLRLNPAARRHADWLLAHIPTAIGREYPGGHIPDDSAYRQMLAWLRQ